MRRRFVAPRLGATLILAALLVATCLPLLAATERPGAVAVATAHPLATAAGLEVLEAGGNAFDAAVAVTAALAVVEPAGSGLGGGGFWLLHRATDGRETMVDGRERAPGAATADMYLGPDGTPIRERSLDGPLAAAIPGIPAGIAHLARYYGDLPLSRTLEPALRLAREGFEVDALYRRLAGFRRDALLLSPAAAALFLEDGKVPAEGFRLIQPDLAEVLGHLARSGHDGFYRGEIARRLVQGVRDGGGIWTLDDLARYQVIERRPIEGRYGNIRVVSAAPPSAGGIGLVTMLNVLSGYPLERLEPADRRHLVIEAMRRAYRDRAQFLGDPDFASIPEVLATPAYATGLRSGIRIDRATPSELLPGAPDESTGADTTHFAILDADGNRVAATLSVNLPFGSGFVAPGTGILLNDEMDDFAVLPGTPNAYGLTSESAANAIAPGKRPLSSMTPTFLDDGERVGILGTPGGSRIITMVLLGVLEFAAGGGPADWVSVGRFHHQFLPDEVLHEPDALTADERAALTRRGHRLRESGRRYGNMQAIEWDRRSGEVRAAADPRGNGRAEVRAVGR